MSCGCGREMDVWGGGDAGRTGGGLGDALYSGAAVYGRFQATVGAILGVIIAVILILVGIVGLRNVHTKTVTAKVTAASCSGAKGKRTCQVTVTYVAGGEPHTATLTLDQSASVGDAVSVSYNPANPKDVVARLPSHAADWGLIGLGVLVGGAGLAFAAATYKSKGFAAASGAFDAVSEVSSGL